MPIQNCFSGTIFAICTKELVTWSMKAPFTTTKKENQKLFALISKANKLPLWANYHTPKSEVTWQWWQWWLWDDSYTNDDIDDNDDWSERSGASEWATGRASGPVLTSRFLAFLNHCVMELWHWQWCQWHGEGLTKKFILISRANSRGGKPAKMAFRWRSWRQCFEKFPKLF